MTTDLLIPLRAVANGTPILLPLPEGLTQLGTDGSQVLTVAGRLLLEALEGRARLSELVEDVDPEEVLRLYERVTDPGYGYERPRGTVGQVFHAAPKLAREVIRLRAEVARFVDEQRRDLKDVEHFRQLARGYMDERDELRLTIAAEQGRPEGAPSEGWTFEDGVWIKGDVEVRVERAEDGTFGWVAWCYHPETNRLDERLCEATTARAAMIAADAAVRS